MHKHFGKNCSKICCRLTQVLMLYLVDWPCNEIPVAKYFLKKPKIQRFWCHNVLI